MNETTLFVYGTLKRDRMKNATLRGWHIHQPDGNFGYPYLDRGGETRGKIIEGLTDSDWYFLDRYEGVQDGLYERRKVTLELSDGVKLQAQAYFITAKTRQYLKRKGRR